jgi:DNA-binding MarR family transcriptional regulator
MSSDENVPGSCLSGPLSAHLKRAEQAIVARKTTIVRALHPTLTVQQCAVLGQLLNERPKSTSQLARECDVTPQTMAGIVANLEAKAWVTRSPSPDHARVLLVSLTTEGAAVAEESYRRADEVEAAVSRGLAPGEEKLLVELLGRVADLAQRAPAPKG